MQEIIFGKNENFGRDWDDMIYKNLNYIFNVAQLR